MLGALARLVLGGGGSGHQPGELDGLRLPDLLDPDPPSDPDPEALLNHLELAFLGRASAGEIDAELDAMPAGDSPWTAAHFAEDLFLAELVRRVLTVTIRGRGLPMHRGFVERTLAHPPHDLRTVRHRQEILRELEAEPSLAAAAEELALRIGGLLALLRASRDDARLEPIRFRFDVLRAFRAVVVQMDEGFAGARSGLAAVHRAGAEIRSSGAFERMVALVDHHEAMASLTLDAVIGSDGRLRHLEIVRLRERRRNPFYRRPLRRWWDRLRIAWRRYSLDPQEITERLVAGVYQEIAPALARTVQLLPHLEIYLASRSFAADARRRGLGVCLPELGKGAHLAVDGLFNPLLLALMERPVPSDLRVDPDAPVVLVTGPNSGGKTRLLQAIGLLQVLGQSGLFAPCARATLPLASGLYASIIELDRAFQSEGRLGTELVRLRTLFETAPTGSLVLLDELCSGTNPSEAIEIIDTVLRLLQQLRPVAFVTTHFLDFAEDLRRRAPSDGTAFLQAEVDPAAGATYRFIPGVATTSLAVGTARRLGVTFEELARRLEQRRRP